MEKKFEANFNNFAQWYIGEKCTSEKIIEYFSDELGESVRQFIGNNVIFIERELPNAFEYLIEGTDFAVDAISRYK